jgi:hypothetical protein
LIEPHYPKAGKGRHPIGLSTMLRIYFLQHWFNLSDPGAEDALYESPALRGFAGVDLGRMAAPDETTILNFRHLLETQDLCGGILDVVNLCLGRQAAPNAQDMTCRRVKNGRGEVDGVQKRKNRNKSRVRAKVE